MSNINDTIHNETEIRTLKTKLESTQMDKDLAIALMYSFEQKLGNAITFLEGIAEIYNENGMSKSYDAVQRVIKVLEK